MLSSSRRDAMKTILGLSAAAVAAQFGISEVVAEDLQLELTKDLNRTLIAMPGSTLLDKQEIWYSVAGVAKVWAEELRRQDSRLVGDARLDAACKRMARAIDHDLKTARISAQTKIMVEVPRLGWTTAKTVNSHGIVGRDDFELRAGVSQSTTLWSTRTRVGYIGSEGIITGETVNLARRKLFGLK